MKTLRYILIIQCVSCLILSFLSFAAMLPVVQWAARINAYERIMNEKKFDFAEDKNNEILGHTPKEFTRQASMIAKRAMNSGENLFLVFLAATIISFIELLILSHQRQKNDNKTSVPSANPAPPSS